MVGENQEEKVIKRLAVAHNSKSYINAIVLDKEDVYQKKSNSFAQLPEIDDRFMQKVAGASGIPVTKFVGIAPAGMNATGESDMRNYYDMVAAYQETEWMPKLRHLDEIIAKSIGYTGSLEFEFVPLQQLSESEQADVDLKVAQRDKNYWEMDAVKGSDIVAELAEKGTYTSIDSSRAEEMKKEEAEFAKEDEETKKIAKEMEAEQAMASKESEAKEAKERR
jgi:hypothetical protein